MLENEQRKKDRSWKWAWIALGSNLGDREGFLRSGLFLLDSHPQINCFVVSDLYETAPIGPVEQGAFLNQVAVLYTELTPQELLHVMQAVETANGRARTIHWGPRTLDLDLLLMQGKPVQTSNLSLPHPHIAARAFVLIPLHQAFEKVKSQIDSSPILLDWIDQLKYIYAANDVIVRDGQDVIWYASSQVVFAR